MQSFINDFWDGTLSNDIRLEAFHHLVKQNQWETVERLYMYSWRANWNQNPSDNRHNIELRKTILLDLAIIQGIKTYCKNMVEEKLAEALEVKRKEVPLLNQSFIKELNIQYDMKDRLRKSWINVWDSLLDDFQKHILKQF